jgi:hypothetical protein
MHPVLFSQKKGENIPKRKKLSEKTPGRKAQKKNKSTIRPGGLFAGS